MLKKRLQNILTILVLLFLLTACGRQPPTWQEQYDLGVRYLSEGNYQEAIIAFTAAIEIDPRNPAAYLGRADAHIASGETEENFSAAQADYENALELDMELEEAYLNLAEIHLAKGNQDAAYAILEQGYEVTQAQELQDKLNELLQENDMQESDNEIETLFHNLITADELLYNGIPVWMNPPNDGETIFLYGNEADARGVYVGMAMDEVLDAVGFSESGKEYIYNLNNHTQVIFSKLGDGNMSISVNEKEDWPYEKDIIIWYPLEESQNYNNAYLVLGFNDNRLDLIEVHAVQ